MKRKREAEKKESGILMFGYKKAGKYGLNRTMQSDIIFELINRKVSKFNCSNCLLSIYL